MINFIVCGLEDTLIDNNRIVDEATINLIQKLKNDNIHFAVASGLNYDGVYPLFGNAKNDIVYICNDGGVIIYQDKVISKTAIDRLVCLDVVAEMEKDEYKNDIQMVFCNERQCYITSHDNDFISYLKKIGLNPEFIKDIRELHGDITKIFLCSKNGFNEETYEHIYMKWTGKANVAISDPNLMFITGQMVTKGTAIALLQHVFDKTEEDTVVFGGGYSDIDMFGHCYYSYAMQTADAQVKRSAKHIAENVNTILEDIMRI